MRGEGHNLGGSEVLAQKGGVDPLTRLNVIPKDSVDWLRASEGPHFGFWVEASRWRTGCTQESVAVGERFGPKNSGTEDWVAETRCERDWEEDSTQGGSE